ncbi:MAG: hypothetical protein EYC70_08750 [Planctomycetota bacterium]|nr:MAG: hypothetical protein EYC70_08750 [Planctomycetota bacterium]
MLCTSLLVLGVALAAPAHSPADKTIGPPAICFPLDIGEAKSLPWNTGDAFGALKDYDLGRLVADTVAILDASDDPLVHMETIRRAALYLERGKKSGDVVEKLLAELRRRIVDGELAGVGGTPTAQPVMGLRWFDLGYAQGALLQMGSLEKADPEPALEKAALLRPGDAARELGSALATWGMPGKGKRHLDHLHKAVELASPADVRLRRNILGTAGQILGVEKYEELCPYLERELAQR